MVFYFLTILMIISLSEGATANMNAYKLNLPETIDVWTRTDAVRVVDSTNIFKYMNGAGELYLAYGFNNIEVFEYYSDNKNDILVELYYMKSSDDAFGLLSLDWSGEPVYLSDSPASKKVNTIAPEVTALYGAGLLRIWSNNIYARVMANQETPASKKAVLALGQVIAGNHKNHSEPELLNTLSQTIDSDWQLRKDRVGYFRSHLVLNSLYYISHQNILNLDHSTEAVAALYENMSDTKNQNRIQFILVKYNSHEHAQQALENFYKTYLPEHQSKLKISTMTKSPDFYNLEDGWFGHKLNGKYLLLVFECPDQESAKIVIQQNESNL